MTSLLQTTIGVKLIMTLDLIGSAGLWPNKPAEGLKKMVHFRV
jgi:hypothetical protein